MQTVSERLLAALKANGADFFVAVPCKLLSEIISLLERDSEVTYIAPNREEEGVGLCAGAYLAGKTPVILMQNSGLGNSLNALCALTGFYQLPLLMLMSHRGAPGEEIGAQVPMGMASRPLLEACQIPAFSFSRGADAEAVGKLVGYARVASRPVGVLLDFDFWREEGPR